MTAKAAPLRDELRNALLERILRGRMAPGSRIKEVALAQELGASRTPIREALLSLEQEGFVRSELARGFSVELLSGREVRETYPILWSLEALAVQSTGDAIYALIPGLRELNQALESAADPEQSLILDTLWHEKLVSCSPNRRLRGLLSGLRNTIRRYELVYMRDASLVSESVKQHNTIIESLEQRNHDGAKMALIHNWQSGMESLLVRLGEP